MAAGIVLLLSLSSLFAPVWTQMYLICNNTGITNNLYLRWGQSNYCYRMVQTPSDFSTANRTCVRENAFLVRIDSQEENDFINGTYYTNLGQQDFWIGLTDQLDEGAFRWIDGNTLLSSSLYANWDGGSATVTNEGAYDCVKFSGNGWRVHDAYCDSSKLPFLCRQRVCNSTDGLTCVTPPPSPNEGLSPAIIAVIVIIPILVIVIIVIIILLIWMWKYRNDAFYRYILCCVYGGSKSQINNLKQENIRLRNELSQQKLNLNSSGRFSQGQMSRQQSTAAVSPTRMNPPLGPIPESSFMGGKVPGRSLSLVSHQVAPIRAPQPSMSSLQFFGGQPVFPGRPYNITSAAGSLPLKAPIGSSVRPNLSPITENTSEVPSLTDKKDRPLSAESSASSDTNSTKSDKEMSKKEEDIEEKEAKETEIEKEIDKEIKEPTPEITESKTETE